MPSGLFTLKQQVAAVQQGAWTNPMQTGWVEYLVVAGGGGGGCGAGGNGGGGAGGGGVLAGLLNVASGATVTVTVGAGGAGAASTSVAGSAGSDSVFGSVTATKGGGGGTANSGGVATGTTGGSGGGAGYYNTGTDVGSQGTTGQGNKGGNAATAYQGGGGGGAGTVGLNSAGTQAGNGGAGIASAITGAVVTYGGGGGGGAYNTNTKGLGGVGGGGDGGQNTGNAAAGTANTGGGGGGNNNASNSQGSGGSGVVILRFPKQFLEALSFTGTAYITPNPTYWIYTFLSSGTITFSAIQQTYSYVDTVFSAYTYTGNGSTQTITNGIDLSGSGGMVWVKRRDNVADHRLIDTVRGGGNYLASDTTDAQAGGTFITAFNSNGYSMGAGDTGWNGNTNTYVSWSFRKAQKFFDIQTWSGNSTAGRTIPHSLGMQPGMVIVKCTNTASTSWIVWHRGSTSGYWGQLESTAAFNNSSAATLFGNGTITIDPDATNITVGGNSSVNITGSNYVAYLFAHDPRSDGVIQCGSFTTDGSGNATVNLGWEPQYVTIKCSSTTGPWVTADSARGFVATASNTAYLVPNTSAAEATATWQPNATGFTTTSALTNSSATYIYLAIRRPNKPPTTGTQVYNAIARTGTGAAATVTGVGFAPDLALIKTRSTANAWSDLNDRLRGANRLLYLNGNGGEVTTTQEVTAFTMDGVTVGTSSDGYHTNGNTETMINWFFKRAPGAFDICCYSGNATGQTVSHSLGVTPELMVIKSRTTTYAGAWYKSDQSNKFIYTDSTSGWGTDSTKVDWAGTNSTVFKVNTANETNASSNNYVAYLFATLAGISKVGNFTGNGSSQTIDCGFTNGARFVLIKRTDSTGDWYVWDSTRGIVAGNDPHLSLNTTAAEVTTDDSVDTDNSGFIVNQLAATNINVTSATYIYLSFA